MPKYTNLLLSALIFIILSFGFIITPVKAQQQTDQVAPGTDNPQNSLVELFNQKENAQTTGSEQLLNNNTGKILIPEGKPILGASNKNKKSNNLLAMLGVIIVTGVTGVVILYMYNATDNATIAISTAYTKQQTKETQTITQQEVAINKYKRKLPRSRKKRKKHR